MVALVHNPNLDINEGVEDSKKQKVWPLVDESNINFFKVKWTNSSGYPSSGNLCGFGACDVLPNNECLCNVTVSTRQIFDKLPILHRMDRLMIGAYDPTTFNDGTYIIGTDSTDEIRVYHPVSISDYSEDTIFRILRNGKYEFLKNYNSQVKVSIANGGNSTYTFRNPPTFMSLVTPESRDAHYETDAVLDHYFYHPNTPTFIGIRLLQRFGFSNPSPRHIKVVSRAFRNGIYKRPIKNISFGNYQYGNLEATIAAILLDREARRAALDADPAFGALREPIIKYLGFMRSMGKFLTPNISFLTMSWVSKHFVHTLS